MSKLLRKGVLQYAIIDTFIVGYGGYEHTYELGISRNSSGALDVWDIEENGFREVLISLPYRETMIALRAALKGRASRVDGTLITPDDKAVEFRAPCGETRRISRETLAALVTELPKLRKSWGPR